MILLQQILLASIVITGVHVTMWEGMVFRQLAVSFKRAIYGIVSFMIQGGIIDHCKAKPHTKAQKVTEYIIKPVYDCAACMASFWGSMLYYFYFHNSFSIDWIIFMFAVAGLNMIFSSLINHFANGFHD